MKVQIRRGKFLNHGADLFEFQFPKNNRWYAINRKSIFVYTGADDNRTHFARIREFFNKLLGGETVRVNARYFRGLKLLAIEFNGGDMIGREERN